MNWFTGVVLFVMIWWTALFAVLPIGTKPMVQPDDKSGWRGAPERPRYSKESDRYHDSRMCAVDRLISADPQRLCQFPARVLC